jgi:hypothetical protein
MTKSEQDREELQKKFDEIKSLFHNVSKSCQNTLEQTANLDSSVFKDLQTKLDEFEQSTVATQEQNQELNNEIINNEVFFSLILSLNYFLNNSFFKISSKKMLWIKITR